MNRVMNKRRLLPAIEWLLLTALACGWVYWTFFDGVSLTPRAAYEKSERTMHYGPSEVKRIAELNGARVYMGTYRDRWFSATVVYRDGIRWLPGGGAGGREIDRNEPLTFTYSMGSAGDRTIVVYAGYAASPDIAEVRLATASSANDRTMRQPIGDDRMFLFVWESEEMPFDAVKAIEGFGPDGGRVYEYRFG